MCLKLTAFRCVCGAKCCHLQRHWGSFPCHSLHRVKESQLVAYFSFSSEGTSIFSAALCSFFQGHLRQDLRQPPQGRPVRAILTRPSKQPAKLSLPVSLRVRVHRAIPPRQVFPQQALEVVLWRALSNHTQRERQASPSLSPSGEGQASFIAN